MGGAPLKLASALSRLGCGKPKPGAAMQERVEVEVMLRARKSLGQIQDRIEAMPVDEEAKSALWLLAWSEQGKGMRRRHSKLPRRPP